MEKQEKVINPVPGSKDNPFDFTGTYLMPIGWYNLINMYYSDWYDKKRFVNSVQGRACMGYTRKLRLHTSDFVKITKVGPHFEYAFMKVKKGVFYKINDDVYKAPSVSVLNDIITEESERMIADLQDVYDNVTFMLRFCNPRISFTDFLHIVEGECKCSIAL